MAKIEMSITTSIRNIVFIAASLIERIADHACYIAASLVYIVEGEKLGLH